MLIERSKESLEAERRIKYTHVKNKNGLWDRVRKNNMEPYHVYYYDDKTLIWCDRNDREVYWEEVRDWVIEMDKQENTKKKIEILNDYEGKWCVVLVDGKEFCDGHEFSIHDIVRLLREEFGAEVVRKEVEFIDNDNSKYEVLEVEED